MWQVNMTGKMKGWSVNSPISLDIVHWPGIILTPASHLCHWLKKKTTFLMYSTDLNSPSHFYHYYYFSNYLRQNTQLTYLFLTQCHGQGITKTKRKEFSVKVDHSILKEQFRVFLELLNCTAMIISLLKVICKAGRKSILGFHMTSPKFKLRNFLFSWAITAPKHLHLYKFLFQKGSSFCNRGHLNFRAFVWHCI